MKKKVMLKDGSQVLIRSLTADDMKQSYQFFQSIPSTDLRYLRNDVTDRKVVKNRLMNMKTNHEKILGAFSADKLVADGSLELEPHGWKKHRGEIRLVISRDFQRKGLGMHMARELYLLAAAAKLEEIAVKMMRPQKAAQKIFQRLGFQEEMTLPSYVKDLKGRRQDMIIMRCDLKALWKKLENYFTETDWARTK